MNLTLRSILIGTVIVVVGLALFLGGVAYGRLGMIGYGPGWMMSGGGPNTVNQTGYGMMGSGMMGGGMMGGGMMGGSGSASLYGVKPLSIQEAQKAIESYLSGLSNDDLDLCEVMIFDNQAYAIVVEKSTGVGAFEVLVDPVTRAVYPEPGPNMMWNLKYGMMTGYAGAGGGMMGGGMMGGARVPNLTAEMPVSEEGALKSAQQYLDASLPGVKVEDEADAFYGYYTIDIQRDGKIVGMLSVNGYNSQVFLHTWHGDFIEMSSN
jgi:hypothetical protein